MHLQLRREIFFPVVFKLSRFLETIEETWLKGSVCISYTSCRVNVGGLFYLQSLRYIQTALWRLSGVNKFQNS